MVSDQCPPHRLRELDDGCPPSRSTTAASVDYTGVVGRVEWSRRPDDVEPVVGVLLCRENPAATRVKPAGGDGGVDVYVPGPAGWTVYQVKSFTGELTSSHKRQIRKSWDSFQKLVREEKLNVEAWYLVRPENPTLPNTAWLEKLTNDAEYPCAWKGLDFLDSLAASYPEVIDYYLHDGKERLEQAVKGFLVAGGLARSDDERTLTTSIAEPALRHIHDGVNRLDPHYRYDFSVQSVPVGGTIPMPFNVAEPPGDCVAAVQRTENGQCVTFLIYAKFQEAAAERPVPIQFSVPVDPDGGVDVRLRDTVNYGLPAAGLPVETLTMDLPGGLGGTFSDGRLTLGPATTAQARAGEVTLRVLDPIGAELAAADVLTEPVTTGWAGAGWALTGRERHGVFKMAIRHGGHDERTTFSLSAEDLTGAIPADVLRGLQVLLTMRPPNMMQFALRGGPALGPPEAIPDEVLDFAEIERIIKVCRALAVIQQHTLLSIRIPDLAATSGREAVEWIYAARLLSGEPLTGTWNTTRICLHPDVRPENNEEPRQVLERKPLVVVIGGLTVPLGEIITLLPRARLDGEVQIHGDHHDALLVPAGDNTFTTHWLAPDQAVDPSSPT